MNKSGEVLIVGAGDLGEQFEHFISNYSNDTVIGWVDDTKQKGDTIRGKTVFGRIESIDTIGISYDYIAVAIGYFHLEFKAELIKEFQNKSIPLYTFIHPTAYVDCSSIIGEGAFIYPNATLDQGVTIKDGTIVNNNTVISHDSQIGSSSFLSPSVTISGNVSIGNKCFIGSGSIIKDSVQICDNTQLGAGTLLLQSIDQPGKYVGGPKLRKL
jgi:sugar O-acyltransferase (sialic acid O-acetyltransferase NeuD family)